MFAQKKKPKTAAPGVGSFGCNPDDGEVSLPVLAARQREWDALVAAMGLLAKSGECKKTEQLLRFFACV